MLEPGDGRIEVLGDTPGHIDALKKVQAGHKISLEEIPAGEPVVKFGLSIGHATCNIRAGEWVHLHNCASNFDERSQTLDVNSGATTDTRYE